MSLSEIAVRRQEEQAAAERPATEQRAAQVRARMRAEVDKLMTKAFGAALTPDLMDFCNHEQRSPRANHEPEQAFGRHLCLGLRDLLRHR